MKALLDPDRALADGLAAIRAAHNVPPAFPPAVLAEAEEAARRTPDAHADWTDRRFVTLDPASATDLDQAFAIEVAGGEVVLHYAIADVAWFVDDGGAIDTEAWARGETLYLPDGKAPLHPPVLSEGAASLLPDGERPAVVFTVRVAADGAARLDAVTRARVRSRAKLAYETVTAADLPPGFDTLTARLAAAERARGAARVDPPEQELARGSDGRLHLAFRTRSRFEDANALLSLAVNMAVADTLLAHGTGLFRVMPAPTAEDVARLRLTAQAFSLAWAPGVPLEAFTRTLDPAEPRAAAFMLAVRRAGHGASYAPFRAGERPWHAAVAATYAQATAPLRRLADRYVVRAALSVTNGAGVEPVVSDAFTRLPRVMARADAAAGAIDRAVIDLAETVLLAPRVGETFAATVTDARPGRVQVQLDGLPVVANVNADAIPGDRVMLRLDTADTAEGTLAFSLAG